MHINFNKKIFLTVFFFIGCVTGLVFCIALPIYSDIWNTGMRLREQRKIISDYDKRIAAARKFTVFAKEEKDNLEKIDKVFIDARVPLEFINSIENAAREVSVEVELFSPAIQKKADNEWSTMEIEADISGNMAGVMRFLKKIENSIYLVEIQNINIQIDTGGSGGSNSESAPIVSLADNAWDALLTKASVSLKVYAKQ